MKKCLFSNSTHTTPASVSLLIQRLVFGFFMLIGHGWGKLMNFSDLSERFLDFMGLGSTLSLALAVFAEVVCAFLVGIGLFTRAALIPLIVTMAVAAFIAHGSDPFFARPLEPSKEMALLFLAGYLSIFIAGPGKFSVDRLLR